MAAHHHDVPFFVAAPTTTIDPQLDHGGLIPIEERSPEEVRARPALANVTMLSWHLSRPDGFLLSACP